MTMAASLCSVEVHLRVLLLLILCCLGSSVNNLKEEKADPDSDKTNVDSEDDYLSEPCPKGIRSCRACHGGSHNSQGCPRGFDEQLKGELCPNIVGDVLYCDHDYVKQAKALPKWVIIGTTLITSITVVMVVMVVILLHKIRISQRLAHRKQMHCANVHYIVTDEFYKPKSTSLVWIQVQKPSDADNPDPDRCEQWILVPSENCLGCRENMSQPLSCISGKTTNASGEDIALAKVKVINGPQPNPICHAVCIMVRSKEDIEVVLENYANIRLGRCSLIKNPGVVQRVQNVLVDIAGRIGEAHQKAIKYGKPSVPLCEAKVNPLPITLNNQLHRLTSAEKIWRSIRVIPGNCGKSDSETNINESLLTASNFMDIPEQFAGTGSSCSSDTGLNKSEEVYEEINTSGRVDGADLQSQLTQECRVLAHHFGRSLETKAYDLLTIKHRRRPRMANTKEVMIQVAGQFYTRVHQCLSMHQQLGWLLPVSKKRLKDWLWSYYEHRADKQLRVLRNSFDLK